MYSAAKASNNNSSQLTDVPARLSSTSHPLFCVNILPFTVCEKSINGHRDLIPIYKAQITEAGKLQVSLGHFIRHFIPDFYDACCDQKVQSIPAFMLFLALLLKLSEYLASHEMTKGVKTTCDINNEALSSHDFTYFNDLCLTIVHNEQRQKRSTEWYECKLDFTQLLGIFKQFLRAHIHTLPSSS